MNECLVMSRHASMNECLVMSRHVSMNECLVMSRHVSMNQLTEDTVRPLKMYWHYNCTRTIIVPLRRVPSEKRSQSCILQTGAEQVDQERA